MGAHLLLIEDDERIRSALKLMLEGEGNTVSEARSAEDALRWLEDGTADVLLVDVMLPGADGFELCRQVRRTSDVPILILTAKSDSHDVVAGLEAGADDYVTKPPVPKELAARIRALLRRSRKSDQDDGAFRFGDVEVEPEAGVVRKGGEEIQLTKTEFRLLCELAVSSGRVLSREALLERVWGYDYFGDGRLVDVHIRRLRGKVEDDPADPVHVVTVCGLGYKLLP